jgi:uncharacterized repeat protein (TIGR01451 family)
MKALRFVLVAAAVAVAGLAAAVPAGATDNTNQILPPKNPGPATVIHCPRDGSLKLLKTADKSDYHLNDVVTFTLKVQASVCDTALVTVHDQLPVGLIVSDPSVLDHSFGSVAAGSEKSFSFQAVAVTKGQWTNKAHASGFSVGYDETGLPCNLVRPPVVPPQPVLSTEDRVIQPPYSCARSADAEATIDVAAPSSNTPPTTPPSSQPPANSGTPSLPNTGRQG